ncbi:serine/threonine-protein kinase [Streptomyces prunicolor]|uniref:serine/threonine-protein kinase n=1 Tax=Streptomyces prunicolor TaxID=67348 RepID=UPI00340A3E37
MPVTPAAGDRVDGRYLLHEPIGTGGMGVVWRAWDERLQRWVAVKCARLDDDRATRRLMGEARNAGRLHHPNIVAVFDFVDEGAICWIVMEYVPSRSLAQLMAERGPLAPEEAGSIGCQIADALVKSHNAGVVHGDVTPENILVTDEGVARLTDFGISRALWNDVTQSATGSVRGKPRYLAPEVAKGQPLGQKADVFSLGASLFAAVEGQSPYGEAEHLMTYLSRAVQGDLETARRAGQLTEPLAALLEVEPRNRPEATRALELLRQATPPPAHVQDRLDRSTLELTSRTMRLGGVVRAAKDGLTVPVRRRRALAIAAVAVVTGGALAAGLVLLAPWDSRGADGKDTVGSDAKPSATASARAGTIGDERTADPCGLIDAASLSRFGTTVLDPDYGDIDRCDVILLNNGGNDNAGVQVNLDSDRDKFDDIESTQLVPDTDLTRVAIKRDGVFCERAVLTPDGKQIRVIGQQFDTKTAPDPCQLADTATDHVVSVLAHGPVPRRTVAWPKWSLANLNACSLLDAAALKRLPGVQFDNEDSGFGSWNCDWSSDGDGDREVEIRFTRDNSLDSDDGTPVNVAGTKSYYRPNDEEDDSCTVRTPHRVYTDSVGERTVEILQLIVYAPESSKQLCDSAAEFATEVVHNVAKKLAER